MQRSGAALCAVVLALTVAPAAARAEGTTDESTGGPVASVPAPLSATSQCATRGFHYAMLVTARADAANHTCGIGGQVYQGWIGVNGQITTPDQSAGLADPNRDHTVGWLGMVDYTLDGTSWIQIGWYSGAVAGCPIITNQTYALYLEWRTPGDSSHCIRLSPLAYGGQVTYRIQHTGNGCWQAFYNYDTRAGGQVCNLPRSMSAQAVNELYNGSGNSTVMPRSVFGADAPDTNQALRIQGANGYEPWDTTLTAGGTSVDDERTGGAPHYFVSSYKPYFHTLTYSG